MRTLRTLLVLCGLTLGVILGLTPHPAQAATCYYRLGFATLHAALPQVVGDCLNDEWFDPANGNAIQNTTHGMMVWRKADNWTAFTDGYQTWVNGPQGIEQRFNTERYCWEADADPAKPLGAGYCQIQGVPQPFSAQEIAHLSPIQRTVLAVLAPDIIQKEADWTLASMQYLPAIDPFQIGPAQNALIRDGYVLVSTDSVGRSYVRLAPGVNKALEDYGLTYAVGYGAASLQGG